MISVVLLTITFIPTLTQQSGSYDPWLDYNEDGTIDVNDLSPMGHAYGSSGDPTKKVTVTNWPVSTDVTVWYMEHLLSSESRFSSVYNASGFGHLHILMTVSALLWGTLDVRLHAYIPDPEGPGGDSITVYEITLNLTLYRTYITIPVPSETFYFSVFASPEMAETWFYLSFYLTWA